MKCPRKCKHLMAAADYLRQIGAEAIEPTRAAHITLAFVYRGIAMHITLPSTPRNEDAAIGIARQQIRRRLREAGFEVQAGLGAKG